MSSSDREFDAAYLRKRSRTPLQCFDDVYADGICLLNSGFPITFDGNNPGNPLFFQFIRALILASMWQTQQKTLAHGFVDLDHQIQEKFLGFFFHLVAPLPKLQNIYQEKVTHLTNFWRRMQGSCSRQKIFPLAV